ncbi:propanoyl-CoA acyltransferase [Robertkochia marina]|uniref:Propanoyl-CoA acyltransferase n=1 Tax=Robertkochia marina TaxID=1227945 RepID=A0A4S3LYS5_9FLAO|nr:beta-ketoacyl synthase N-terminal-like domain-containing protein [Robertkochia marina]THD66732.1 propanoyl-CoA acyltransferase [Robertkochia marina]TRZ42378.1 propanoyl-CoA acyltransferase [Robertkochia marina]
MNKSVFITGAYNTKFGRLEDQTLYSLFAEAAKGAIEDAGIPVSDIDAVFVGNYSGGSFNNQEHLAPFGVNVLPELRHKPMYRTESACASGTSAIQMGMMALKSGMAKNVLVVGVEKMNSLDTRGTTEALAKASYWEKEGAKRYTFPGLFAEYAKGYMDRYGYTQEQVQEWMAAIASKAYEFGSKNPLAHMGKARSKEDILNLPEEKNPMIANPLRLHDCSLISDGAAAVVLSSAQPESGVEIAASSNATDYLDIVDGNRPNHFLEGASVAVKQALDEAGLTIDDIQVAEVHDCFTITELLIYSALGLTAPGKEYEALENRDVYEGGRCVVNPSGGLKSKGHPVGATGVSMHALLYKQLMGEAIGVAVPGAKAAIALNIGGSGATNMASVLKKV